MHVTRSGVKTRSLVSITLASRTNDRDPQPEPPERFLDRQHVGRLTQCSTADEPEIPGESVAPGPASGVESVAWQPERLVRTCVGDDTRQRRVWSPGRRRSQVEELRGGESLGVRG